MQMREEKREEGEDERGKKEERMRLSEKVIS